MVWPDIVVVGIFAIGALKGFKRGFISELGGAVALGAALWSAFHYNGVFDGWAGMLTHAGEGSAHIIGMLAYAFGVYLILLALSFALGRVAQLPVVGLGNSIAGALVGVAKSVVFVWALLYIALFFPLTRDVRDDFHHSVLVRWETSPNARIDGVLVSTMPFFVRPFVDGFLRGHRV